MPLAELCLMEIAFEFLLLEVGTSESRWHVYFDFTAWLEAHFTSTRYRFYFAFADDAPIRGLRYRDTLCCAMTPALAAQHSDVAAALCASHDAIVASHLYLLCFTSPILACPELPIPISRAFVLHATSQLIGATPADA